MARVLPIELARAVETKVTADTVGVGRGALAAGLGRKQGGTALLAGKADVHGRTRVTCMQSAAHGPESELSRTNTVLCLLA